MEIRKTTEKINGAEATYRRLVKLMNSGGDWARTDKEETKDQFEEWKGDSTACSVENEKEWWNAMTGR